ncbi:hypothetical protein [Streptomyces hydrogenans]|uniref:hypothetical protein n=1 Tax=Streptomyces hydrogenans TaxID=1873719 RepID=UPI0036E1BBF3
MNAPDDAEFGRMMQQSGFGTEPTPGYYDPHPYGPPAHHPTGTIPQAKPGLTTRGKVALGVVGVALAGGALIGYQSHTETVAENQARTKELEIQAQLLRIEEIKALNTANESTKNSRQAEERTRQASVDSCVNEDKSLVGKGFGSPSYRDVIDNCLARYTPTTSDLDLKPAGSATAAPAAGGGQVNSGFLIGGAVLIGGVLWAAKRGTRPNNA